MHKLQVTTTWINSQHFQGSQFPEQRFAPICSPGHVPVFPSQYTAAFCHFSEEKKTLFSWPVLIGVKSPDIFMPFPVSLNSLATLGFQLVNSLQEKSHFSALVCLLSQDCNAKIKIFYWLGHLVTQDSLKCRINLWIKTFNKVPMYDSKPALYNQCVWLLRAHVSAPLGDMKSSQYPLRSVTPLPPGDFGYVWPSFPSLVLLLRCRKGRWERTLVCGRTQYICFWCAFAHRTSDLEISVSTDTLGGSPQFVSS